MSLDILFPTPFPSKEYQNLLYYGLKYLDANDAWEKGTFSSRAPRVKALANSYYDAIYSNRTSEEYEKIGKEFELHHHNFLPYTLPNFKKILSSNNDEEYANKAYFTLHSFSFNVMALVFENFSMMYHDFGNLRRKISPPLEAYVYKGTNQLDIKPTHKSYGTLYE